MSGKRKKESLAVTCVVWTLLCVGCMAVMLLFAARKTIVIADVSQEQSGLPVNSAQEGEFVCGMELLLAADEDMEKGFRIPLPKGVKAENVTIENRYLERELWLYIQSREADFYRENTVSGDLSPVVTGRGEEQEGGILLKFRMNRVLEYKSTMEGNALTIAWYEPKELYDYVVVLDPAGGGGAPGLAGQGLLEKDLTLQVARQVQKKFTGQDVRLYLTRTEDVTVRQEERLRLADEVEADLYLGLCASAGDTPETYGISGIYNEEYFIPGFGNMELADTVTRAVTIAAGNRAVGLAEADDESLLKGLGVPSAQVSLGYLTNPQECWLMGQESYQEKLAEGILNAVSEAVEALRDKKSEGEGNE